MFNLPDFWQPIVVAWLLAQLSLWWALRAALYAARRFKPVAWAKFQWRRRQAGRLPLWMYPSDWGDARMRRFTIKEIYALDQKGNHIGGIIEPVHPDYWLDSEQRHGKGYLFGLARRNRELERADCLRLVVAPEDAPTPDAPTPKDVQVKVLYTDAFGLDGVSRGDYWSELPQLVRFRIQARLSEELMRRAQPEIRTSLFQTRQERYPFGGVAFAVTGLGELDALFPPG